MNNIETAKQQLQQAKLTRDRLFALCDAKKRFYQSDDPIRVAYEWAEINVIKAQNQLESLRHIRTLRRSSY